MGLFNSIRMGSSAAGDYEIERSLRINKPDEAYLTRAVSSTGNQKVWTFSAWIKRAEIDNEVHYIYSANDGNSAYFALYFQYDELYSYFDPGNNYGTISSRKFRDPGTWFHLVHQVDAVNTTQRVWIDGEELTLNSSRNPGNSNYPINQSGITQYIGTASWWTSQCAHLYLAEIHFSDGNKYTPSDFAETNALTGQWVPKSPSITYGTNGYYLNFSDNSGTSATTLGKDSSGNGNNFTPNNFSVAAGSGNDSLIDTPTNNFCTLNPINKTNDADLRDGALTLYTDSNDQAATGTFAVNSGKWYWEVDMNTTEPEIGIAHYNMPLSNKSTSLPSDGQIALIVTGADSNTNFLRVDGSTTTGTGITGQSGPGIISVALDMDNKKIWFTDTSGNYFNSGNPATGANAAVDFSSTGPNYPTGVVTPIVCVYQGSGKTTSINFGQRPFTNTAPTGFKTLCTANIPDPAIKLPDKHFDTVLYTGTGSSQSITGLEFQPDWVWIKKRNGTENHELQDAVRGATKRLASNTSDAESTVSGSISAFNSDGFTVVDAGTTNENGNTYVAWNWNAGGSTVTNNDGNNTSQIRANPSAGISIVSYTGTGADNTNVTMGHGLGVTPDFIWVKNRSSSALDRAWHVGLSSDSTYNIKNIIVSGYAAQNAYGSQIRDYSSSTFTVRDVDANGNKSVNKSGDDYIAYVFSSVEGYSKFGKYTGNGNANGTFVYTGFRPAFVITRGLHGTSWYIYDNKRNTYNVVDKELNSNNTQSEATYTTMDFLSNGFKLRTSNDAFNYNNYTYIYLAFAKSPFKYSRAR